jgi:GDP-4-dehydro-6-deoxy-D-mannose reductase
LDVRDVARAYADVIARAETLASGTILNVATGAPRRIADVLADLTAQARRPFAVEADPARMRPSEIAVAMGDAGRLRAATGWEPRIPWATTLADILADARARVAIGAP